MTLCFKLVARGSVGTAALLACLSATLVARAATSEERVQAQKQFTKAEELRKAGQAQEALALYQESQRLDPKLMTLVGLATVEEQLGKVVEAQVHWAEAVEQAKQDKAPKTLQRAEEHLAAVEKRIAHLTLQLPANAPAGLSVSRNGAPVEQALLGTELPVNPGAHEILVTAPEHEDAKYSVQLADGASQSVTLAPGASKAPPPPPPKPAAPPPKPVAKPVQVDSSSLGSGSGQRVAGVVLASVGVATAGVGTYLWIIGARDANSLGPTADRNALLGKIGVISGGVLFATGVVLFIAAPSGEAKAARLPLVPVLGADRESAFLGAAGRF